MTFSSTFMDGRSRTSWNVRETPLRAIWRAGSPVMVPPRKLISPSVAGSAPEMRFSVVDLPDPFGPISPSTSCSRTSKLTLSTATSPPNCLVAPRSDMTVFAIMPSHSAFSRGP